MEEEKNLVQREEADQLYQKLVCRGTALECRKGRERRTAFRRFGTVYFNPALVNRVLQDRRIKDRRAAERRIEQ